MAKIGTTKQLGPEVSHALSDGDDLCTVHNHSLIIRNHSTQSPGEMYGGSNPVNFQSVGRNTVIYIAGKLKKIQPEQLDLFNVRLYGTRNFFAEWFASDNL